MSSDKRDKEHTSSEPPPEEKAGILDTISGAKDAAVAGIKKAVGLEGDAADGQAMLDKLLGEHAEVTKGEALDTIEKGAEEVRASGSRAEKFDAHEQVGK